MITTGCKVLVIASIDGDSLSTVLTKAKEANIPVIAYDRLIKGTDAVSYYATFDNLLVGTTQGEFIRDTLDLEKAAGPFNIELFTGSPDDNNARYFFKGAMDVLQPYIDNGKLVVVSGQKKFEEVATLNWSTEEAQKRMENIITAHYADGTKLDAVLSSNDSVANGITNALLSAGYTAENFPVLTGQDCDIASVKNIIAGTQSMSIFKDTRTLASQVVSMVEAILQGEEVSVNDTESYDNGTGIIPTFLCQPVFADKDNYQKLLIDSGYYTIEELQ
jgi:putative multiple sugar transport system substrate-binding protein